MLRIKYFTELNLDSSDKEICKALEKCDKNAVECINWPEYAYKPAVTFQIAHNGNTIFLKYNVSECNLKALRTHDSEEVWKDSCVEFFLSPDNEGYYNLETNCIGTVLLCYGKSRSNREPASLTLIKEIGRYPSLGRKPITGITNQINWQLILKIPAKVFFKHKITDLSNLTMSMNVYKCGDELATPHYLTWKPVKTDHPDFHQPEYFGNAEFLGSKLTADN